MASKLFQLLGRSKSKDRARARKLAYKMPDSERVRYVAKLDQLWKQWTSRAFKELGVRRDHAHLDALSPLLQASFNEVLEQSDLGTFIEGVGERITGKALNYMKEVVRVPATVSGKEDMLASFRKDNIALIKDVGAEQAQKLDALFASAGGAGVRNEELVSQIQDVLGVGQSRAERIARDQLLKFNASVHEVAQRSAGISEFIWSTSGDERVRPSHADIHGNRYSWDDPPVVDGEAVTPGEPIECRCAAVPVVPLLDDI